MERNRGVQGVPCWILSVQSEVFALYSPCIMDGKMGFQSRVAILTEYYLLLPVVVWFGAWVQPWLSVPVILCLLYLGWKHYRSLRKFPVEGKGELKSLHVVLYMAISALAVFLLGLDGRVMQSWDLIVRNPIYSELVNSEWPLVMPDGRVVMYALMFWLPPALVSKWITGAEVYALQTWCFLGVLLMLLNLHGTLGWKRTVLMVIGISVFVPLAGMVDDVLNVAFHIHAKFDVHFRLPSAGTQWTDTFHYFIVGGLYLCLTTERKLPLGQYVLLSALFACLHPILASVVFPLVVWNVLKAIGGWRCLLSVLKLPEVYVGGMMVLITMLYYSSGGICWWSFTLNAPHAPADMPWLIYILGMLLAVIPPFLVWWSTRQPLMLLWCAWCPVIITCWYGEYNGVNEWLYKFTVLYSFYIVYYLVQNIQLRKAQLVAVVLLVCSSFSFLRKVEHSGIIGAALKGFPVEAGNIRDDWGNSLYHPDESLYWKLTAEKRPMRIFR